MVKSMPGYSFKYTLHPLSHQPHCWSLACYALLCFVLGCGEGPSAEFGWRTSTEELISTANAEVKQVMRDSFGTPQKLVGWERMPVNYGGVQAELAAGEGSGQLTLALADPKQAESVHAGQSIEWLTGSRAGAKSADTVESFDPKTLQIHVSGGPPQAGDKLIIGFGEQMQLGKVVYMKNCLHCHGVAGDGAGPTAKYLNPRPRDFRLGIVKFTSTLQKDRATRADLHRTISYGIPGTYMPSFLLMKEDEKTAVVEYVRWLAMRGQMEKRLGDDLADYNRPSIESSAQKANSDYEAAVKKGEKPEKPATVGQAIAKAKESFEAYRKEEFAGAVDESADFIADLWTQAEDEANQVVPKLARVADTVESRQRGRLLFMSNRAKCYTCHGPLGRGDGSSVDDFWPKEGSNEKYTERGLHDFWGQKLQPRDLTKGQYRGGRRPLDVYRRISAGIKGTPMPPFGTVLKDEEIWDLVNYVMNIPFESSAPSSPKPAAMASMPPEPTQDR